MTKHTEGCWPPGYVSPWVSRARWAAGELPTLILPALRHVNVRLAPQGVAARWRPALPSSVHRHTHAHIRVRVHAYALTRPCPCPPPCVHAHIFLVCTLAHVCTLKCTCGRAIPSLHLCMCSTVVRTHTHSNAQAHTPTALSGVRVSHSETATSPHRTQGRETPSCTVTVASVWLESRQQTHLTISNTNEEREALRPQAKRGGLGISARTQGPLAGWLNLPGAAPGLKHLHPLLPTRSPGKHPRACQGPAALRGAGAAGVTVLRAACPRGAGRGSHVRKQWTRGWRRGGARGGEWDPLFPTSLPPALSNVCGVSWSRDEVQSDSVTHLQMCGGPAGE